MKTDNVIVNKSKNFAIRIAENTDKHYKIIKGRENIRECIIHNYKFLIMNPVSCIVNSALCIVNYTL